MSAEEAVRAIETFFEGFNAENDARIREALNFPHVRIASGSVRVIEAPEEFNTPFAALKSVEGWHHSTLDRTEVIHEGADKVHFDVAFSRFLEDGSRYATHRAIWVVTRVGGHWGIQARSSFAP
ncbi:MAG: hypothetical protein GY723_09975 [bacterium]|nr:hypothetical protein [bacterium]